MKYFILIIVFALVLAGCDSWDGTTSKDIQKVKDNQVVDMHGK